MWSGDGQIRHRFDVSIGQNVTSIAYINQTKNIIIAQVDTLAFLEDRFAN